VLEVDEEKMEMVKEIRILGYRMDQEVEMGVHTGYWLDRGIGVKRRIVGLERRYSSYGRLGAWECQRRIQGVYIPTVYYGLEFVLTNKNLVKEIQVDVNDILWLKCRSQFKFLKKIIYGRNRYCSNCNRRKILTKKVLR